MKNAAPIVFKYGPGCQSREKREATFWAGYKGINSAVFCFGSPFWCWKVANIAH
jgi:hypothetical protein